MLPRHGATALVAASLPVFVPDTRAIQGPITVRATRPPDVSAVLSVPRLVPNTAGAGVPMASEAAMTVPVTAAGRAAEAPAGTTAHAASASWSERRKLSGLRRHGDLRDDV